MTTKMLMIAMQDSLLTVESSKNGWISHESLKGTDPQCVAFDPSNPNRAYCGTFGNGLWRTNDSGHSINNNDRMMKPDSRPSFVDIFRGMSEGFNGPSRSRFRSMGHRGIPSDRM